MKFPLACLALACLLLTSGCQDASPPPAATVTIPSAVFAAPAPAEAVPLATIKKNAKPGDRVVFEARVGGRRDPFIADRAVFFVTDPAVLDCSQLHGDTCKTPWDYCCEPKDNLLANMATVQVVDAAGLPLKTSLQSASGLEPSRTVLVTGTVEQMDEAGTFVVNAETIYVKDKSGA